MTNEPRAAGTGPLWAGRLAVILIVSIVVVVGVLLYFAARGPR